MAGIRPPRASGAASPLRSAATAYMDPQAVKPDTIGSLMDLSDQAREMLQGRGYATQVPQQEAPSVPSMAAYDESQQRAQTAGMLHQAFGMVPPTISQGNFVRAGTPMNSPADQATDKWAANPWAREQQSIDNANKLHAFNNQYAQMKSLAANTDTQHALDLARDTAISAAYGNMMGQDLQLRREMLKDRLTYRDEMLKLARERNARQEETAGRPSTAERSEYLHATGAKVALTNLQTIIQSEPEARDLLKGLEFDWGNLRKNTSPTAQALVQERDAALDHLAQMQRRMTFRGASGQQALQSILGKFGDDPDVGLGLLDQFLGQANAQREGIRAGRDSSAWDSIDAEFLPKIRRQGSAQLGGKKKGGGDIDEAMKRLGIK